MREQALELIARTGLHELLMPLTLICRGDDARLNKNMVTFHEYTQHTLSLTERERQISVATALDYYTSEEGQRIERRYVKAGKRDLGLRIHRQNLQQLIEEKLAQAPVKAAKKKKRKPFAVLFSRAFKTLRIQQVTNVVNESRTDLPKLRKTICKAKGKVRNKKDKSPKVKVVQRQVAPEGLSTASPEEQQFCDLTLHTQLENEVYLFSRYKQFIKARQSKMLFFLPDTDSAKSPTQPDWSTADASDLSERE